VKPECSPTEASEKAAEMYNRKEGPKSHGTSGSEIASRMTAAAELTSVLYAGESTQKFGLREMQ